MPLSEASGPIHAYLRGSGVDGSGRALDCVLALDDDALESVHDYIQWLFPLSTRSMAQPGAPVLTDREIAAIREDPEALANLGRAAERMLGFYGRTTWWLRRVDHNHLRITRILRSLKMLAGQEAARRFYEAVITRHKAAGSPVDPHNLRYWTDALDRS